MCLLLSACSTGDEADVDPVRTVLEAGGENCVEWTAKEHAETKLGTWTCVLESGDEISARDHGTIQDAAWHVAWLQQKDRCVDQYDYARTGSLPYGPAIGPFYLAGPMTFTGDVASLEGVLDDSLDGQMYAPYDAAPPDVDADGVFNIVRAVLAAANSWECQPGLDVPGAAPSVAPRTPTPSAAAEPAPTCVENCTWTRADVIRDLEYALCSSQIEGHTLSQDVTSIYQVGADQVLLCTGGGSMDTTGFGITYLFDDSADITDAVLKPFAMCDSLGAAVYAKPDGNPGYLVAGIVSGQAVVDALVEGGATVICAVP